MPIYEYHCENCGKEFEKLMGFSDPNINHPECPDCHSDNTHKQLSTIAGVRGGSGAISSSSNCASSTGFR